MLDKVGALHNLSLTAIALMVSNPFLAIHAFGMRCFKVLDKVGALCNLSLTSIALMLNSFLCIDREQLSKTQACAQRGGGGRLPPFLRHETTTIESEILCYPKNM